METSWKRSNTSWRQHRDDASSRRGVGEFVPLFRRSNALIGPKIALPRIIARFPFAGREIRRKTHAFTGVGSPKAAEQCGGPSGGTAMCRNTHRWRHREHGYGRTVGTDNTIDLRRLTALCCSSDRRRRRFLYAGRTPVLSSVSYPSRASDVRCAPTEMRYFAHLRIKPAPRSRDRNYFESHESRH